MMTDDHVAADKGDQLIGSGKEAVGKVTGDEDLEAEGKGQHLGGKLHEIAHDLKEHVKDVVREVKEH